MDTYGDGEAGCHSVEVVRVLTHSSDLWNYRAIGPVNAEYFCQFLEILGSCFSD